MRAEPSARAGGRAGGSFAAPGARARGRTGQVLIEMILVIPIFLMVVFMIMELGNLAFNEIVLHHVAFELARIGSLAATPRPGEGWTPNDGRASSMMHLNFSHMYGHGASMSFRIEGTLVDPESGQQDNDLVVDVHYKCPLVFPLTSLILASSSETGGKSEAQKYRMLNAEVRMPIEQPVYR